MSLNQAESTKSSSTSLIQAKQAYFKLSEKGNRSNFFNHMTQVWPITKITSELCNIPFSQAKKSLLQAKRA